MAEPSAHPIPSQIKDMNPQSANGRPIMDVLPADWGKPKFYRALVEGNTPTQLLAAVDVDPSDALSGLPVAKTMEVVALMILNYNQDAMVLWGDESVAPGFGVPIRAATDSSGDPSFAGTPDTPGTALLKIDPASVWLYAEGSGTFEVVFCLVGRNVSN